MVTPAQSTWKGNQSLSEWDQIGCTTYTSSIYFYAPTTLPFQTITQTIIDSLSHTLPHFYPLAGRLRSLNNGRFQLECNGNGVVFVAAELNADLSYFEKDYFTPTLESDRLLPYVNESLPIHELPLLLVQLTKFSCGGLSLGVTASHVLIDGLSAANFMTEWARIARGLPLQKAPFFDKKAFGVGDCCGSNPQRFDHSNDFGNMPFLLKQPNAEELKKMKTTMFTLKLTKEQGIDFGWGKEIHFGPAYHEIDGDLWIIRNSCDDDESLLIVICLLVEHVEAFKMYFFDDMI
ncbi:hypothetical protein G4B88_023522 [Cannabis sativa]|uniref:Uncharacterized protein n=1 Tax=Cannabis sativa TaxID=3483 RepID=A0A7J6HW36_CANSA|nr:hypothetical protein G4B88_023522 [Cannabis sativa]